MFIWYYTTNKLIIVLKIIVSLLFIFFLCVSCKHKDGKVIAITTSNDNIVIVEEKLAALDSIKLGLNFKPKGNYSKITKSIKEDQRYFKTLYLEDRNKAIDSASKYLYSKLLNIIVPHWYGTPWDFNGYTNIPNTGEIACGYFVSTTLKHMGFNLNRYKMAQQAGLNIAKALQPKQDLKIYSNATFNDLKTKLNKVYHDGIYFVGLDNHVGYVLLKDNNIYFLHSSYCDDIVVIELAEISPCFGSNLYVFAEITTNRKLIESWILNKPLVIPLG